MSYSSEVLADAPTVYLRMGDAAGTTLADSSGNGYNGVITSGTTMGVAGALTGDTDKAVTLNGTTQFGQVAYGGWGFSSVTLEAWVKTTDTDGIVIGTMQTGGQPYFLRVHSTLGTYFQVQTSGGSAASYDSNGAVRNGAWHHIVGTFTPGTVKTYVDGALVATNTTGAYGGTLTVNNSDLTVGRRGDGVFLSGSVDEVAVYGVALSAARILAHYNAGIGAVGSVAGTVSGVLPSLSANLSGSFIAPVTGSLSATLPDLSANLAGTSAPPAVSGSLSATLPALSVDLAGETYPPGVAGDITATLPPLSANLAGTSAAPVFTGTLAATLPALRSNLAGQAFGTGTDGYLDGLLPALSAAFSGGVLGRTGLGLALDSSAVLTVADVLEPEPPVPAGTPSSVLHIIAATVPTPTLVAGRPS